MDIDSIKKEYTKKIEKYKNIIIDSFIEYYGEEHKETITERFNDINFMYYINDITIFYIVDKLKTLSETIEKNKKIS